METVASISFVGTDLKKVRVNPLLSGLTHVKATFPTPFGVLKVEHILKEDGKIESSVSAPKEIEII